MLQVVAEQVPQALPVPAIGLVSPSASFEKEAKREKSRCPWAPHRGQDPPSVALLIGSSSSNLTLQLGQKYS